MNIDDKENEFDLSKWIICKAGEGGFIGWFVLGLFGTMMFVIELLFTVGPFVLSLALMRWWPLLLWIVTFPIAIGLYGWIDDMHLW